MEKYDVLIIGSGVAGLTVAKRVKSVGYTVALVEGYKWGGATVNHGSTAKKYLLAAVEKRQAIKDHLGIGFDETPKINWQELMNYKNQQIEQAALKVTDDLKQLGVVMISGEAKFENSNTVTVNSKSYTADRIVLATGARPRKLDFEGKEYVKYSSDFLNAKSLPPSITIIGAGIIAFAITNIASAVGDTVHVLQHNHRALAAFDSELVGNLMDTLKDRGVQYHFDHSISKIFKLDENLYQVTTKEGLMFETNIIYSVVGRIPNVENIGLENANIQFSPKGIAVNEYLQTTNPNVYAIGDCNDSSAPKLTNYAEYQGNYVADLLANKTISSIRYPIPSMSVFSNPKIAQTGVTVNEAKDNPSMYTIETIDMKEWLNYKRENEPVAKAKLVIRNSDHRIVGMTSLSNEADLLINYFTLLLTMKLTKEELRKIVFAYPSLASDSSKFFRNNG